MKQFLLAIFSVAFFINTSAQISITENDMPDAPLFGQADSLRYSTAPATTSAIDVTQTGANHTWDFSFLQPNGQGVNQYKNSTTTLYSFLGAGFNAIGLKQPDVSIPLGVTTIALTDAYEFYNKTTSVFEAKATGYSISSVPLSSLYSNTDKIYKFPLNYNDVDTDDFHYTLSISNVPGISISITYTRAGQRVNEVDGFGSITTPFGTFNCIRVKSTITETDSIDVGFGFAIPVPNNRIEYKWLANGIKIPVLEIDQSVALGIPTTTSIKYRDIYRNLAPSADFIADNTTPLRWQPVTFTNQTTSASSANITYRWSITPDSMFTYMNNTTRNSANPVVNFDVDTVFNVQLKATNSSGVDSVLKVQYIKVGSQIAQVKSLNLNHNFAIYPNPSSGKIFVNELNDFANVKAVKAFDISGHEINLSFEVKQNVVVANTTVLCKGSYVLQIITANNIYTKGFAKTE